MGHGGTARRRRAAVVLIGIGVAVLTPTDSARTHVHANDDGSTTSWYPADCCHAGDCRPVASIRRARQGLWMSTVDGYTILTGPQHERRVSRDNRWHVCIGSDDADAPYVRCVFEPPNS